MSPAGSAFGILGAFRFGRPASRLTGLGLSRNGNSAALSVAANPDGEPFSTHPRRSPLLRLFFLLPEARG
jgi:hypothetical protein